MQSDLEDKANMIRITGGIRSRWSDDGVPVKSESLPDGRTRHTMKDGRTVTVSVANYRLDYQSTLVGAEPGDTYEVNVALTGCATVEGFFEAWNFDTNKLRNYRFDKTVSVTRLLDGSTFTGAELQWALTEHMEEEAP